MRLSTLLSALLVAVGCADDGGPVVQCPSLGNTMSVGTGTSPMISWEPRCPLDGISVMLVNDTTWMNMWIISSEGGGYRSGSCRNLIWPGVRYGEVPTTCEFCQVSQGPRPLESGVTYRLTLMSGRNNWDRSGCNTQFHVGVGEFTP